MTSVPVEKELLEALIDLKLRFLYDEIDKILNKWSYEESSKFLQDARDGTIEEAENDAIELRQFLYEKDQLYNIVKKGKLNLKFEKFKSLRGILPKETLNTFLEEKKKSLEREEKRAPLN